MSKISIIIQREYLSRVKKKSFIIMTLLVPILFVSIIGGAIMVMSQENEKHFVQVVDESTIFMGELKSTSDIHFSYTDKDVITAKSEFHNSPFDVILYIPYKANEYDVLKNGAQIYFKKQPGIMLREVVRKQMENILYDYQLEQYGIDIDKVEQARKFNLALSMIKLDEDGTEATSETGIMYGIGFVSGLLIYMFILLYGIQVMRGVIEEKSSRIVEVIISSVKPFQLMMGKIIGVAMVGLTQFLMWVVISFTLFSVGQTTFLQNYTQEMIPEYQKRIPDYQSKQAAEYKQPAPPQINKELAQLLHALTDPTFIITLLLSFVFYFLGGYLLYSALFAAFGAAVDSETETQQFMMPVTLPLILAYIIAVFIMQNPHSGMAFWFSIIPFTSPVVMMARLPFSVPLWELLLSMALLVITFLLVTWLAAKIYRTGILMYGKKVSYKELWKWLRYSG